MAYFPDVKTVIALIYWWKGDFLIRLFAIWEIISLFLCTYLTIFCDAENSDHIFACYSSSHHFVCMFDVPPNAKAEVKVLESATDAVWNPLKRFSLQTHVQNGSTAPPPGLRPSSALFLSERACNVAQVQRISGDGCFPATLRSLARINVHGFGNGVHGVFAQISESFPRVLLPDALLEGLALVSELDDCLGVGVDGGDRGAHAAGEGRPGHADRGDKAHRKHGEQLDMTKIQIPFWHIPSILLSAGLLAITLSPYAPSQPSTLGHVWDEI